MAVISTASFGASRSGLYARRSISMPSTVQTNMAATMDTIAGIPRYWVTQKEIYAPTMMTSPWAKFNIFAMP